MRKHAVCRRTFEHKWLALSFAVPVVFLWCVFALKGIYPFGDRHVLISDAQAQYFPFLSQLQYRLQNGESLFYSWNNGFGNNFWALIAYYCLNPWSFLTALIPASWLMVAYTVFLSVKMGLIGLTFAIFLKKISGRNDGTLTLFSSMYAFSAYFMSYYWNTMWLDAIMMLPLLSLGTYYLVKEGKFKLFTVSLALGVLFNFLIGIYLCIFTFLSFIYWCVCLKLPWKTVLRRLGRIAVCSVAALGFTAVFLLPAYYSVMNTPRAATQIPSLWQLNMSLPEFLARFGAATPVSKVMGHANVYCGIASLLAVSIYLTCRKIPLRQRLCTLVLIVFLLLSSLVSFLEFFWSGFRTTYNLPGRFTFLLAFVIITAAYQALAYWKELSIRDLILPAAIGGVITVLCLLLYGVTAALVNVLLLVGYCLPVLLVTVRKIPGRTAAVILTVVMTGELLLACYLPHHSVEYDDYNNYPENAAQINTLTEEIDGRESGFYRMEVLPKQTYNDPSLLNYRGVSSFCSLLDADQMNCLYSMGYSAHSNVNCSIYLYENSPFTNALFGIKYLMLKDGMAPVGPYMTQTAACDDVTCYENEAALSVGFMADPAMNRPLSEDDNALVRQNELFCAATGMGEDLFSVLEHTEKKYEGLQISEDDSGRDHYVLTGEEPGHAVYTYEMPRDGYLYCYVFCNDIENFKICSDTDEREQQMFKLPAIFCAGYYHRGEQVQLCWDITGSDRTVAAYAGILNEDVFEAGLEQLGDEQLQVEEVTETSLTGTLNVDKTGYFFTSVPYDEGWTLYLNGEETPITPFRDAFVAVEDLEPGTYTVQLKFVPKGLTAGLYISIGAAAVFAAMCILDAAAKKRKKAE